MDFAGENLRKKCELEARTRRFAVAMFKLLSKLPVDVSTRVIAFQVGRSASSIGANYHEANRAESRADFAHKLSIVLKETSETGYWIAVLSDLYPEMEGLKQLQLEVEELMRLFQSSMRTLRTNRKSQIQS